MLMCVLVPAVLCRETHTSTHTGTHTHTYKLTHTFSRHGTALRRVQHVHTPTHCNTLPHTPTHCCTRPRTCSLHTHALCTHTHALYTALPVLTHTILLTAMPLRASARLQICGTALMGGAHIHMNTYICTHTHAHVHMHTYTCTHTHTHIHMHTYTCTHTHAHNCALHSTPSTYTHNDSHNKDSRASVRL